MKKYFNKRDFVCASDGFFPFTDSINLLNKMDVALLVNQEAQ